MVAILLVGILVLSINQAAPVSSQTQPAGVPVQTTNPVTVNALTLAACIAPLL